MKSSRHEQALRIPQPGRKLEPNRTLGRRTMLGFTFSFDRYAIGLIWDLSQGRPLGTGFAFLKPTWVATAKHVVLVDGLPRDNLGFHVADRMLKCRVLARHPEIDLALLELIEPTPCVTPFYPSHVGFTAGDGLISIAYFPTKSTGGSRVLEGNHIPLHTIESRERSGGTEDMIVFSLPASEGGNSGSPVMGTGGGVVGVVVQDFKDDSGPKARATSIKALLDGIVFANAWQPAHVSPGPDDGH
jgi:hypothetical protein